MNRIVLNLQKKNGLLLPAVVCVLGIVFGQLAVRGIRQMFPEILLRFHAGYQKEAVTKTMESLELFGYLFLERTKGVLIFWLLNLTIFGLPYYMFCLVKKSFQISFLFGTFLLQYGGKGFFLGLCNYFPELLALLPLYYLCLKFGLLLIGETKNGQVFGTPGSQVMKKYGIWIFISILLCAVSAALAAWFGQPVLAWAVKVILGDGKNG